MKKILICLFSLLFVFTLASTNIKASNDFGLAYDATELIDKDYLETLGTTRLVKLSNEHKIEFRIDILSDMQGYTIEQLAEGLANQYNYGYSGSGDLIYLLLVVEPVNGDLSFVDFDLYSTGANARNFAQLTDDIFDALLTDLNENTFKGNLESDNLAFKKAVEDIFSLVGEGEAVVPQETVLSNVFTDTNIISIEKLEALNQKAKAVSEKFDSGVYIEIVDSMEYYGYHNIEDFSEAEYRRHNLGMRDDHDGILLILSMRGRDYDLVAHGNFANYSYTDYGKDLLADYFLDDFRNDNWEAGFSDFISQCEKYLQAGKDGTPIDVPPPAPKPPLIQRIITAITGSIVPAILLALGKTLGMKGKLKNTRIQTTAFDYVDNTRGYIYRRRDNLINHFVTRHKIEKPSSGSSGRGGTTVNSRGYSHSSGKF